MAAIGGARCHNPPVTRYRRTPRRQGVVYGPPIGRDSERPTIAGRLLGAAVVLGALALMAGVTFTFLGRAEQAPVASPSPTTFAAISPTPAAPTPLPPPLPTPLPPTPTPEPSPTAEPSPTTSVVEVVEGPGAVTFGRRANNEMRIPDPIVIFTNRGRIAWSAELIEPAGEEELTLEIARFDPDTGEEDIVTSSDNDYDEDTIVILRRGRIPRVFEGPGIYVVRYLRDDAVLAQGYLQIEE